MKGSLHAPPPSRKKSAHRNPRGTSYQDVRDVRTRSEQRPPKWIPWATYAHSRAETFECWWGAGAQRRNAPCSCFGVCSVAAHHRTRAPSQQGRRQGAQGSRAGPSNSGTAAAAAAPQRSRRHPASKLGEPVLCCATHGVSPARDALGLREHGGNVEALPARQPEVRQAGSEKITAAQRAENHEQEAREQRGEPGCGWRTWRLSFLAPPSLPFSGDFRSTHAWVSKSP